MAQQIFLHNLLTGLIVGITGTGKTTRAIEQIGKAFRAGIVVVYVTHTKIQLADVFDKVAVALKFSETEKAEFMTKKTSGSSFNEEAKIIFTLDVYFKKWTEWDISRTFAVLLEKGDYFIFDEASELPQQLTKRYPRKHLVEHNRPLEKGELRSIYKAEPDEYAECQKYKQNIGWSHKFLSKKGTGEESRQTIPVLPRQNGGVHKKDGEQIVDLADLFELCEKKPIISETRKLNIQKPGIYIREQIFKVPTKEFQEKYEFFQVSDVAEIEALTATLLYGDTGEEVTKNDMIEKIILGSLSPMINCLYVNDFGDIRIFEPKPFEYLRLKNKQVLFLSPEVPSKRLDKIVTLACGEDYPRDELKPVAHMKKVKIILVPWNVQRMNGLFVKFGKAGRTIDKYLIPTMEKVLSDWETFPYFKALLTVRDKSRLQDLQKKTVKVSLWQDGKIGKDHKDYNALQILAQVVHVTYFGNEKLIGLNLGEIFLMGIDCSKKDCMPMAQRYFEHGKDIVFRGIRNQAVGRTLRHPFPDDVVRNKREYIKYILLYGSDEKTRREQAEEIKKYIAPHVHTGTDGIEIISYEDQKRSPQKLVTIYNTFFREVLDSYLSALFQSEATREEITGQILGDLRVWDRNNLEPWQQKGRDVIPSKVVTNTVEKTAGDSLEKTKEFVEMVDTMEIESDPNGEAKKDAQTIGVEKWKKDCEELQRKQAFTQDEEEAREQADNEAWGGQQNNEDPPPDSENNSGEFGS